jgi:uncharacterized protein YbjQ (UPF0145 family)
MRHLGSDLFGPFFCPARRGTFKTIDGRVLGWVVPQENEQMIISTTETIEGKQVVEYLGVVSGDEVMGTNIFRDMFPCIRFGSYKKELRKEKEAVLEALEDEVAECGADAVIGVDLDYEVIGSDKSTMLMVSANGTAVRLS